MCTVHSATSTRLGEVLEKMELSINQSYGLSFFNRSCSCLLGIVTHLFLLMLCTASRNASSYFLSLPWSKMAATVICLTITLASLIMMRRNNNILIVFYLITICSDRWEISDYLPGGIESYDCVLFRYVGWGKGRRGKGRGGHSYRWGRGRTQACQ